jgi:hypothetical protein
MRNLLLLLLLTACTPFVNYGFTDAEHELKTGRLLASISSGFYLKTQINGPPNYFKVWFYYDTKDESIHTVQIQINYLKSQSGKIPIQNLTLEKRAVTYTKIPKMYFPNDRNIIEQYGMRTYTDVEIDYEMHEMELHIKIYDSDAVVEEKTLQLKFETDYEESISYYIYQ